MQITAIATQKGGAGKTTTAHNLAAAIFLITGVKPLVIDLDPQGNLTTSCGYKKEDLSKTILEFFDGEPLERVAVRDDRFDLIPSNGFTADLEIKLVTTTARETVLKRLLKKLEGRYEHVLLDCPGNLGLITINALVAADRVLVPVQCEFHALGGIADLERTIEELKEAFNLTYDSFEAVATFFSQRLTLSRDVRNELRRRFTSRLYDTPIRTRVALAEAPSYGEDIFEYGTTEGAEDARNDYRTVAKEFLKRGAANGIS